MHVTKGYDENGVFYGSLEYNEKNCILAYRTTRERHGIKTLFLIPVIIGATAYEKTSEDYFAWFLNDRFVDNKTARLFLMEWKDSKGIITIRIGDKNE